MQEFNIYIEREEEREMFSFCVLLMTKAFSKWLRYRTFIKMNLMLAFSINFISKNFTVSNIVMNELTPRILISQGVHMGDIVMSYIYYYLW